MSGKYRNTTGFLNRLVVWLNRFRLFVVFFSSHSMFRIVHSFAPSFWYSKFIFHCLRKMWHQVLHNTGFRWRGVNYVINNLLLRVFPWIGPSFKIVLQNKLCKMNKKKLLAMDKERTGCWHNFNEVRFHSDENCCFGFTSIWRQKKERFPFVMSNWS